MNEELIALNEVLNDGTKIFFYPEETAEAWAAWGYSAYRLSLMAGGKCLTSFSDRMQMPCARITDAGLRAIVRDNRRTIEYKDGIYILPADKAVDANVYRNWVASLK